MRRTLLLCLALVGCEDSFKTEEGQLRLFAPEIVDDEWSVGFANEGPILAGTRMCVIQECEEDCWYFEELPVDPCFEDHLSGPATFDADGCVVFDEPGEVTWTFLPQECHATSQGYGPDTDRVSFTAVDPAETTAMLYPWPEVTVDEGVAEGWIRLQDPDGVHDRWSRADGEPLRVYAGGSVELPLRVLGADGETLVGWNFRQVEVVPDGQGITIIPAEEEGWIRVEVSAGADAVLRMTHASASWELLRVVAVPPSEVASLSLAAAYTVDPDHFMEPGPLGVRAVVADADGAPIFGAPVTWSARWGDVALEAGGGLPGEDYRWVRDACRPPSKRYGSRSVVVRAALDGQTADMKMSWDGDLLEAFHSEVEADVEQLDAQFIPHGDCPQVGCAGCASGGSGRGALAALAFGLVLVARRRSNSMGA
ncbi:MAG: hypothetical protein H6739_24405 [Alphaproteobacteria bacterium]|nr:hypothetical protein [Alphaproteobacteria bacterium]